MCAMIEDAIVRSQIKLGKIFGIEIGLHYSWFLIAILIVTSLYAEFHRSNAAWGDGVILAMAIATALIFHGVRGKGSALPGGGGELAVMSAACRPGLTAARRGS